jgi:sec-independent protein translocase protein TatB
MIEISFGKLLLLALIALLVLGPEKLPGAARTAGALVRRVRNSWESVRDEVARELEIEEIKRTARDAAARAEAAQAEMRSTAQEFRAAVGAVAASPAPAVAPLQLAGEAPEVAATPAEAVPAERDTLTGDLFAGDPEHAPERDSPHGLA